MFKNAVCLFLLILLPISADLAQELNQIKPKNISELISMIESHRLLIESIDHENNTLILRTSDGELINLNVNFEQMGKRFEDVVIPTEGASHREYLAARSKFKQELLLEYKRKTIDSPEVKALMLVAIQNYINRLAMIGDFPSRERMKSQCHKILKLEPKDPFTIAFIYNYIHQKHQLKNKDIQKYSLYTRVLIESWLSCHSKEFKQLQNMKVWITQLNDDPYLLRYAWWLLDDIVIPRWKDVDNIKSLLKDNPNIHPWIKSMLEGELHVLEGWDIRGNSYGHKVKPEAWPLFHEHLRQAGLAFTKAFELNPNCPEAPDRMITIATAYKSDKTALEWFYEAVKISGNDLVNHNLNRAKKNLAL